MLTAAENLAIESAVRRLLAQATVTPAEIVQLLESLPQSRPAMERMLEVAREMRWPGVPLLEAAVGRLGPLPEVPDPNRPKPPPIKLTSRMSIPVPPIPPEVARDLSPPPVKQTSRMSIPVPQVPPALARDLSPPPVKPSSRMSIPVPPVPPEVARDLSPPPVKQTSRMSIPVPQVPPELARDLSPPPVKQTSRMSIPVPPVPPEVARDLSPPPAPRPIPTPAPQPVPTAAELEAALAAASNPELQAVSDPGARPATGKASDPSVKFMRTTGKYRVIDNTPDLPPMKPSTSGPNPVVEKSKNPSGKVKIPTGTRTTQRIAVPDAPPPPPAPTPEWVKFAVAIGSVMLGVWLTGGDDKRVLPASQPRPSVRASVAPQTPLPPAGSPMEIEGVVVASAPGKVIVKSPDERVYLVRGMRLPVGARMKTRAVMGSVARDGVVLVDVSA